MDPRYGWLALAGVQLLLHAGPAFGFQSSNLAANAGFEERVQEGTAPPQWHVFTTKISKVGVMSSGPRCGEQCVRVEAQGIPGELQGLFLTLPVTAGSTYAFSVNVRNDRDNPLTGSAFGLLLVEWKGPAGELLYKVEGGAWHATLSRNRWETVRIPRAKAPPDAVEANFCIHLGEGDQGASGAVFLDDVLITAER